MLHNTGVRPISSELYAPIAIFFCDFSVFSPKKIIREPSPHLGTALETPFPLSFGKSYMKIRSAFPENGCLIFMHYRVANGKTVKTKNIYKTYTHSRHLAARMRKSVIPTQEYISSSSLSSSSSSSLSPWIESSSSPNSMSAPNVARASSARKKKCEMVCTMNLLTGQRSFAAICRQKYSPIPQA